VDDFGAAVGSEVSGGPRPARAGPTYPALYEVVRTG
jgi:hypothetical protein